jgi:hypothetical protein
MAVRNGITPSHFPFTVIEWDFLKQPHSVKLSNRLVQSHSFALKWQSCYAWFVVDYLKECKMLFWLNLIK